MVIKEIKKSVREIIGRAKGKTAFEIRKEQAEKEFEKRRVPTEKGIAIKTTGGEIVPGTVRRRFVGGRGGRSFSERRGVSQAQRKAEAARQSASGLVEGVMDVLVEALDEAANA